MNKFRYVKRVKVLSEFPSRKKKGQTLFREKFKFRFVPSTKSYFILTLMAVKSAIRHARCKMQKKNFVFFFLYATVEKENRIKNIQKTKFDDSHREIHLHQETGFRRDSTMGKNQQLRND